MTQRTPRPGSMAWDLRALAAKPPGARLLVEAPSGQASRVMRAVATDLHRLGLSGVMAQAHMLGVITSTREVLDVVVVTYKGE